jgi:hypothetical protein
LSVGVSAADTLNRKIRPLRCGCVMGLSVLDAINDPGSHLQADAALTSASLDLGKTLADGVPGCLHPPTDG